MDISDQMIKEMQTAYAAAIRERSDADKARFEARVAALQREHERRHKKDPSSLIAGINYPSISREEVEMEEEQAAVARAVQKFFPVGMQMEEAFKRLRQLKEQGFETSENRYEGARDWPEGEIKPYLDEGTKRSSQQQYPKGVGEFIATKDYGFMIRFLATRHVAISFRVVDGSGVISEVKGDIGLTGL